MSIESWLLIHCTYFVTPERTRRLWSKMAVLNKATPIKSTSIPFWCKELVWMDCWPRARRFLLSCLPVESWRASCQTAPEDLHKQQQSNTTLTLTLTKKWLDNQTNGHSIVRKALWKRTRKKQKSGWEDILKISNILVFPLTEWKTCNFPLEAWTTWLCTDSPSGSLQYVAGSACKL